MADDFCKGFAKVQKNTWLKTGRKDIAQIEHSMHCSFNNFIVNSLPAIAAYCFFEKKPAIDVNFINNDQLTLF